MGPVLLTWAATDGRSVVVGPSSSEVLLLTTLEVPRLSASTKCAADCSDSSVAAAAAKCC